MNGDFYARVVRPDLPEGVRLEKDVYVPMRDGVNLAVDIYSPVEEGEYPAILSVSPYIKDIQLCLPLLSHSIEAGATGFFVPRGYVQVIANARGSGLSQGQLSLFDQNMCQDGYDLVEWISAQPWCNGNVGMLGDSFFAVIQMLVASTRPPHLECIVPYDGLTDLYRDALFPGGQLKSWFVSMWYLDTMLQALWPGPVEGKLPPVDDLTEMLSAPHDGPLYWERSPWTKIDQIETPMMQLVPLSLLHSRGQLWAYPRYKVPKKLVITPRTDSFFENVMFNLSQPLNEHILRWFDYWLKGEDNGIMDEPEVAIFDKGSGSWRYEREYPLARTEWNKYYLRANPEGPATTAPFGLIDPAAPEGDEEPDSYFTPDLPLVMAGQPVMAFASAPLREDLRVWGPASIVLYASTTTTDTVWFVKVGELKPDGTTDFLSEGCLKASYREVDESRSAPGQPFHPFDKREYPEAGRVYEFQIELTPIFYTFRAGHKIWVQIQSDDPSFQTLLHTIYTSELLPAPGTNTVYHDAERPSHLLLPVIPDAPEIQPVEPPLSEAKWPL